MPTTAEQPLRRLGASQRPKQPLQVSAVGAFSPGGRMLWGSRLDSGLYTTPGGHLEPGESPLDAAVRELWEEAGIDADPSQFKLLGSRQCGQHLVHCYRLDLPDEPRATSENDPDGEVGEWRWVDANGGLPEEVLANLKVPPPHNALLGFLWPQLAKGEPRAATLELGLRCLGDDSAEVLVHPSGAGYAVRWADAEGELGQTGPLSKAEAAAAVGEWSRKVARSSQPQVVEIAHAPDGPDRDGEYVVVRAGSSPLNLRGWKLTDAGRKHSFSFPDLQLQPHATVKVWTKAGKDGGGDIYWGRGSAVWNNDGDAAQLEDPQGRRVSSLPCAPLSKAESKGRDVLVCIPKGRLAQVEAEERQVAEQVRGGMKGGTYFWTVGRLPKATPRRVYFAWDGAVRAYHKCVGSVQKPDPRLLMDHRIHELAEPIPMRSFRGWRYFNHTEYGDDLNKAEAAGKTGDLGDSELVGEVDRLVRHPDPSERAMALKLSGVTRRHLAQALLSGDPVLEAAALAHPNLDSAVIDSVAGSAGRWDLKRKLLARPELRGGHFEAMVRSALLATSLAP